MSKKKKKKEGLDGMGLIKYGKLTKYQRFLFKNGLFLGFVLGGIIFFILGAIIF